MISIRIQNLTKRFGATVALRNLDLVIEPGELFFLLGPSGCGKTTLLRTIIGALLPTQGSIQFNGQDVSRLQPNQRARVGMAYVPQGREIFPNLSVTDNLRMGWVKRGRASADDLDALLDNFPRLKPLLDRMGGSLSGGEQQLLALARALAGDPQLLLLDEPTEGIQPSIIEEIAETLTALRQQRSLTIVLVEQNLDFIASVSERVLVIKRGQITGEIPREHLNDLDTVSEYTGVSSTH